MENAVGCKCDGNNHRPPTTCGPGSSVSIATGYGLDGPGIESPTGDLHSTINDSNTMVPMAWSHLPSATVNNTETLETRRLGFNRHSGKMPNSTLRAYVVSKPKRGNSDS